MVGTNAGQIQLTVMLESSRKTGPAERVRPTIALFAAAYCGLVSILLRKGQSQFRWCVEQGCPQDGNKEIVRFKVDLLQSSSGGSNNNLPALLLVLAGVVLEQPYALKDSIEVDIQGP